jgi:hypothetical protein
MLETIEVKIDAISAVNRRQTHGLSELVADISHEPGEINPSTLTHAITILRHLGISMFASAADGSFS